MQPWRFVVVDSAEAKQRVGGLVYAASNIDAPAGSPGTYANVAQTTLDALTRYADDVRAARRLPGGR